VASGAARRFHISRRTPLFQHAANYMGHKMKAINPTYDAQQVARAMVRCAEHGGPGEVIVGTAGVDGDAIHE
jgi:hypothetical protein